MSDITKAVLEYVAEDLAHAKQFSVGAGVDEAFDKQLYRAPLPLEPPLASPLCVSTLRSFAEYVSANRDGLDLTAHVIHVVSPQRVDLVSRLEPFHRRRETPIAAVYAAPENCLIDKWAGLEDAVITLMSLFTGKGDRDAVLELLKNVTREGLEIREDSGLSQSVTVKDGVRTVGRATTPNPVFLAPFRTFPEVEQPLSPFVFRLRNEPISATLKSADGGAWKLPAVEAIAVALERLLPEDHPAILY